MDEALGKRDFDGAELVKEGELQDDEDEDEDNDDGCDKAEENKITIATRDARTKLNMILIVAGEPYGRRKLLQFRDVEYRLDLC